MTTTDYIVVPVSDAELAREALGRLFLLPATQGAGVWPVPGQVTRFYTDPQRSADGEQAAFGPRDTFLESVLGKTVQCTSSEYTLPASFVALESEWFPPPATVMGPPPPPPESNP